MAKTYSVDLREKVAGFVGRGGSCREAARVFGVSASFVIKLMQRYRLTGSVNPAPRGSRRGSRLDADRSFLVRAIKEKPDQTMPELAARLQAERDVVAAPAVLSRYLIRIGMTRKKRRFSRPSRSGRTSPSNGGSGDDASGRCAGHQEG